MGNTQNSSESGIHKIKLVMPQQGMSVEEDVQNLVWALVDEYITEPELERLEGLILQSDEARSTYISCIQLHVDLIFYFANERRKQDPGAKHPFPLPSELQELLNRQRDSQGPDTARCQALQSQLDQLAPLSPRRLTRPRPTWKQRPSLGKRVWAVVRCRLP